jgi:hypothetical protein
MSYLSEPLGTFVHVLPVVHVVAAAANRNLDPSVVQRKTWPNQPCQAAEISTRSG